MQATAKSASEKLLDAAMEVFAREGLGSATTREIAKVAGVNEVTLFRNFQNKQGLVAAAMERAFLDPEGARKKAPSFESGASLREIVTFHARTDFERKLKNIALMRVLMGDIHRIGEQEAEVLKRIFQPWKDELAAQFRQAQERGLVRAELDPVMIVDQLVGLLFIGALRMEGSRFCVSYSQEAYLASCVDLIVRGIATGKEPA